MKMNILTTECDCNECSLMCRAPCCGTPDDIKKLIDNGYIDRLMYDDLPGGEDMIKPALKNYEGKESPWQTTSFEGCTFWKDGKCELHNKGLKPLHAKLIHHSSTEQEIEFISEIIENSWKTIKAKKLLKKYKNSFNK